MNSARFEFAELSRAPDVQAANLFAFDQADRLLIDSAAQRGMLTADSRLAVVDDDYGALTLGVAALHGVRGIRVCQDSAISASALAANAATFGLADVFERRPFTGREFEGRDIVLLRLPRSLDALDETAAAVAQHAPAGVVLLAGGMVKHMTRSMNDVLAAHFGQVSAGLARGKARVLTATTPHPGTADPAPWPRREFHSDYGIWLVAHGGVFAGTRIDIGTRAMLQVFDRLPTDAATAIDLGCGTGVLGTLAALRMPSLRVIATDQSARAVSSAAATAEANGVADRVSAVQDDAGNGLATGSADLVLVNPPFHSGAAVHAGAGLKLIRAASRLVRDGGQVWTVFNSHLAYQPELRRAVGPTRQLLRTPKFTVTASVRRPRS